MSTSTLILNNTVTQMPNSTVNATTNMTLTPKPNTALDSALNSTITITQNSTYTPTLNDKQNVFSQQTSEAITTNIYQKIKTPQTRKETTIFD